MMSNFYETSSFNISNTIFNLSLEVVINLNRFNICMSRLPIYFIWKIITNLV